MQIWISAVNRDITRDAKCAVVAAWRGRPGGVRASAAASTNCPSGPSASGCTPAGPLSRQAHHLTEVVPAGPEAGQEAERVRTRLPIRSTSGAARGPVRPLVSYSTRPAAAPAYVAYKPHVCRGLADSTVRQVHWIISGALDRGVVWQWIAVNPTEHANKPPLPTRGGRQRSR